MHINKFIIEGLFGNRRITLPLEKGSLVLVGPNGLGKSSVANIFYYTLSRQWRRLSEYKFSKIHIEVDSDEFSFSREEVSGFDALNQLIEGSTGRTGSMIRRLISVNLFDNFIKAPAIPSVERKKYAAALDMPVDEVLSFQRFLLRKITSDDDLMSAPSAKLEKRLAEILPERVLYLPTYRRIERDMREVFPGLEERFKRYSGPDAQIDIGRSGNFYVELVNFGMEDVKRDFKKVTQELRNYSLAQYNDLSGSYLRDVIRGNADKYNAKEIATLGEEAINAILDRVSETTLPFADKKLLRERISSIQNQKKNQTKTEDRYLAHYFSRLVAVTGDIVARESRVSDFVAVCNAYLKPGKTFNYDEVSSIITITDDLGNELDLSVLSSGEKQIVSLFSHLYLEEHGKRVVIIDEPELSLSVPWQKRFLLDIVKSSSCEFLLAVTHSPFVYENDLKSTTVDLRKLTERSA